MKAGDIVVNTQGWQGEILEVVNNKCLVQYASRREWEYKLSLYVVVSV